VNTELLNKHYKGHCKAADEQQDHQKREKTSPARSQTLQRTLQGRRWTGSSKKRKDFLNEVPNTTKVIARPQMNRIIKEEKRLPQRGPKHNKGHCKAADEQDHQRREKTFSARSQTLQRTLQGHRWTGWSKKRKDFLSEVSNTTKDIARSQMNRMIIEEKRLPQRGPNLREIHPCCSLL